MERRTQSAPTGTTYDAGILPLAPEILRDVHEERGHPDADEDREEVEGAGVEVIALAHLGRAEIQKDDEPERVDEKVREVEHPELPLAHEVRRDAVEPEGDRYRRQRPLRR